MRFLPHHQDTGGFFVAVIRKTAPLPWQKEKAPEEKAESKTDEKWVFECITKFFDSLKFLIVTEYVYTEN